MAKLCENNLFSVFFQIVQGSSGTLERPMDIELYLTNKNIFNKKMLIILKKLNYLAIVNINLCIAIKYLWLHLLVP